MNRQKILSGLAKCFDTFYELPIQNGKGLNEKSYLMADFGLDSFSLEMAIREEFDDYFYDEIDLQGEDKDISVSELMNLIAEALDYDVIR